LRKLAAFPQALWSYVVKRGGRKGKDERKRIRSGVEGKGKERGGKGSGRFFF
jgi:hypothetical protein